MEVGSREVWRPGTTAPDASPIPATAHFQSLPATTAQILSREGKLKSLGGEHRPITVATVPRTLHRSFY